MVFVKLQRGSFACLLVVVSTKSVVDAFWDFKFGSLSIMAIQGILITFLFYQVINKKNSLPKFWLRTANIYTIALSLGIIWGFLEEPLASFEIVMLNFNIYLGFLLLPVLINDKKKLKQFLFALMICGIFPIIVSIYQKQTGVVFRERSTAGLIRFVGFYHDAFPTRFYGLMSIISILIYNSVFRVKSLFIKIFFVFLVFGALLSIYNVFSKAAITIFVFWALILFTFSESRGKKSLLILIGFFIMLIIVGNTFYSNIEQLFSKELGFNSGKVNDIRYTLAGRGYIWEKNWIFWTKEQSVFYQLFGDGISRAVHNEFFRVLMANGIFGLIFLIIFIIRITKAAFKINKRYIEFGLMFLSMYIVDCTGLAPGSYYYYNILVWGIFGLMLMKPQLFIK